MTNIVDTSDETINAEFDAAQAEIGTEEQAQQDTITPEQAEADEAQKQAEIAMATGMIATSLRMVIGGVVKVSIDTDIYRQAAESYAVLIIKYYPGGMFAFLDRYKEELAAVTSTVVLIQMVATAKAKAREEEENAAKQAASGKPTFTPDQEAANDGNA